LTLCFKGPEGMLMSMACVHPLKRPVDREVHVDHQPRLKANYEPCELPAAHVLEASLINGRGLALKQLRKFFNKRQYLHRLVWLRPCLAEEALKDRPRQ